MCKVNQVGGVVFLWQSSLAFCVGCLTKRAPDVWDSAAFLSIFLASSFFCSQAESTPAHTQVTQTVRRWLKAEIPSETTTVIARIRVSNMVNDFLNWIFIIAIGVISLLGIVFVYFIGRHIIASIAPAADEKFELYFILKDIKRYFGFLFEKGYKIRHAGYAAKFNGNWDVQFESQDCVIYIVQDRGHIEISFIPVSEGKSVKNPISLEQMIFLITQGRVRVSAFAGNTFWGKKQQFERMAKLLREYIDKISPYFGKNYSEYKDELNKAF